ncbi:Uncharacterized conserved protein, DUF1778 family [Chromohalobacter canadensis]|uniref:Uncharacterized conserved protein, DUF1778 family n=1 Tax=Chromohalobacter canadensis TaxID=141389 RepID=A0A285VQA6_9GAMM|nr:DUF1778 domain-containing protein [Chromohalobacter canadensis]SOC56242.1 Uncharacterized conserved protein, DUF1778 family [Chromohalobacter canadensis]
MLTIPTPEDSTESRQRNTARFNFRTTQRIKDAIERAAALKGQDMSAFALDAVYERAVATLQAHDVTHLKPEDHHAFFEAMENPPAPADKLRVAFDQHEARVERR